MNSLSLSELARYYGDEHAFEMQRFFRQENEERMQEEIERKEREERMRAIIEHKEREERIMQATLERIVEDYEREEMEISFSPSSEEEPVPPSEGDEDEGDEDEGDEGYEEKKGDEEDEEQKEEDLLLVDYEDDSDLTQEQQWIMEQQRRALHPEIDYDYDGEIEDDYWNDPDYQREGGIDNMMQYYPRKEF